jgi:hypothetical protein
MRHRNEKVSMGMAKGREYQRIMVRPEEVRRLLENALNGAPNRHSAERASLRTL